MTNYATRLRDHLLSTSPGRSNFPARLRSPVADGRLRLPFLRWQRNFPIPSSAAFGKISGLSALDLDLSDNVMEEASQPYLAQLRQSS